MGVASLPCEDGVSVEDHCCSFWFCRFNEHFIGNYNTAVNAVLELLPSLKEAIQQELDAEAITEQLRHKLVVALREGGGRGRWNSQVSTLGLITVPLVDGGWPR